MKEFLIRRKDGDFCLIHTSKFSNVLCPTSFASEKNDGWGDYRIKAGDCEIAFSFEEVRIQISFEMCEIRVENAEQMVNEISRSIEKELQTSCYWTQISD